MNKLYRTLMAAGLPAVLIALSGLVPPGADLQHARSSDIEFAMPDTLGTALFREECASCHGNDGKGGTRAGRRAGVKDFTDAEYQASFTDDEALDVISTATKDGEELKNKKPYADKLTEDQIRILIAHVRSFATDS